MVAAADAAATAGSPLARPPLTAAAVHPQEAELHPRPFAESATDATDAADQPPPAAGSNPDAEPAAPPPSADEQRQALLLKLQQQQRSEQEMLKRQFMEQQMALLDQQQQLVDHHQQQVTAAAAAVAATAATEAGFRNHGGQIEPPAGERDMGGCTEVVYTHDQQFRLGVDERGNAVADEDGGPAAAGGLQDPPAPGWTQGAVEAPAGEKDMGGFVAAVYTSEQQARLGVNDFGESTGGPALGPALAPAVNLPPPTDGDEHAADVAEDPAAAADAAFEVMIAANPTARVLDGPVNSAAGLDAAAVQTATDPGIDGGGDDVARLSQTTTVAAAVPLPGPGSFVFGDDGVDADDEATSQPTPPAFLDNAAKTPSEVEELVGEVLTGFDRSKIRQLGNAAMKIAQQHHQARLALQALRDSTDGAGFTGAGNGIVPDLRSHLAGQEQEAVQLKQLLRETELECKRLIQEKSAQDSLLSERVDEIMKLGASLPQQKDQVSEMAAMVKEIEAETQLNASFLDAGGVSDVETAAADREVSAAQALKVETLQDELAVGMAMAATAAAEAKANAEGWYRALEERTAENDDLRAKVENLQEVAATAVAEAKANAEGRSRALEERDAENDDLRAKVEDLQEEQLGLTDRIASMASESRKAIAFEENFAAIEDLNAKVENLEEELALAGRMAAMAASNDRTAVLSAALDDAKADADTRGAAYDSALQDAVAATELLDQQLAEAAEQHEVSLGAARDGLARETATANAATARHQAQLDSLQKECAILKRELALAPDASVAEKVSLELQLQKQQIEGMLNDTKSAHADQVADLRMQVNSAQAAAAKHKADGDDRDERLATLTGELSALTADLESTDCLADEQAAKCTTLEGTVARLMAELAAATEAAAVAEDQLAEAREAADERLSASNARVDTAEAALSAAENRLVAVQGQLAAAPDLTATAKVIAELKAVGERLSASQARADNAEAALSVAREREVAHAEQVAALEAQLLAANIAVNDRSSTCETLAAQLHDAAAVADGHAVKHRDLEDTVKELKQDHANLISQHRELQGTVKRLEKGRAKAIKSTSATEDVILKLQGEANVLRGQLATVPDPDAAFKVVSGLEKAKLQAELLLQTSQDASGKEIAALKASLQEADDSAEAAGAERIMLEEKLKAIVGTEKDLANAMETISAMTLRTEADCTKFASERKALTHKLMELKKLNETYQDEAGKFARMEYEQSQVHDAGVAELRKQNKLLKGQLRSTSLSSPKPDLLHQIETGLAERTELEREKAKLEELLRVKPVDTDRIAVLEAELVAAKVRAKEQHDVIASLNERGAAHTSAPAAGLRTPSKFGAVTPAGTPRGASSAMLYKELKQAHVFLKTIRKQKQIASPMGASARSPEVTSTPGGPRGVPLQRSPFAAAPDDASLQRLEMKIYRLEQQLEIETVANRQLKRQEELERSSHDAAVTRLREGNLKLQRANALLRSRAGDALGPDAAVSGTNGDATGLGRREGFMVDLIRTWGPDAAQSWSPALPYGKDKHARM